MTQTHTILLIQPGRQPGTRTYAAYDSVNQCMEGLCKTYEAHLKRRNQDAPLISYDVEQLHEFVDELHDISCLVYMKEECMYAPFDRHWIKRQLYLMLRRAAYTPGDFALIGNK